MAGNLAAGGGRANRPLVDLSDTNNWWKGLKDSVADAGAFGADALGTGGVDKGPVDTGAFGTGAVDGSPFGGGVFAPGGLFGAFRFVQDLRTGSLLEVSALVEASQAALTDGDDAAASGIEPINAWMYGWGSSFDDASAVPKLAGAGGDGSSSSVFAKEPAAGSAGTGSAAGSVAGADKAPESDLDNWPPAGWNGFDKTDVMATVPGAPVPKVGGSAGAVEDDPVHFATKLIGTDGDDTINGTTGNDFFNGLGGDDLLNGGPGDDQFTFAAGFGHDIVFGFTAGDAGDDVVEFHGVFQDFADVQAASRQVGTNVIIEADGDNSLALIGVALGSLNQDDFRFV